MKHIAFFLQFIFISLSVKVNIIGKLWLHVLTDTVIILSRSVHTVSIHKFLKIFPPSYSSVFFTDNHSFVLIFETVNTFPTFIAFQNNFLFSPKLLFILLPSSSFTFLFLYFNNLLNPFLHFAHSLHFTNDYLSYIHCTHVCLFRVTALSTYTSHQGVCLFPHLPFAIPQTYSLTHHRTIHAKLLKHVHVHIFTYPFPTIISQSDFLNSSPQFNERICTRLHPYA